MTLPPSSATSHQDHPQTLLARLLSDEPEVDTDRTRARLRRALRALDAGAFSGIAPATRARLRAFLVDRLTQTAPGLAPSGQA
ncbi:MAG: hypothetical protein AAGF99_05710 [Bacteroidota bacterium]